MIGPLAALLLVFYAGAVAMNATAWLSVRRGLARYSTLRELTGIADRAVLTRLFGRMDAAGRFKVNAAGILRHRRMTGVLLSDIAVNLGFLAATVWAATQPDSATSAAIFAAGLIHLVVLAGAAFLVLVGSRQILLD